jgi:hypothetical protein
MSAPRYLKERGQAIWETYEADRLPEGSKAMVHEFARLADALDKLDMILGARATEWAKIVDGIEGEVTLEVNGLLGERRQHALAFKVLYNELRAAGIKERSGEESEEKGRGGLILSLVQDAG